MENHGKSQCLFCGKVVIYYRDLVNLKTHLKIRHDITENLELAVSLLFLCKDTLVFCPGAVATK